MNKTTRLFVRVSDEEKETIAKAGGGTKSLSAFVLKALKSFIRYRRFILQIMEYEKQGVPLKAMEVRVK